MLKPFAVTILFVILSFALCASLVPTPARASEQSDLEKILKTLEVQAPTEDPLKPSEMTIDLPPDFTGNSEDGIRDLIKTLRSSHNTTFNIRVQGPGGDLFLMNDLATAILDSKTQNNTINMRVVGLAASADAFITCYADKVTMDDGASLMFHQAYGIKTQFFGFLNTKVLATDNIMIENMMNQIFNKCSQAHTLTDKDIQTVKEGRDVIITKNNGSLTKTYNTDSADFTEYGLPVLLDKAADLILLLTLLTIIIYIFRKAGK